MNAEHSEPDVSKEREEKRAEPLRPEVRAGLLEAMDQLDRGEGITKTELFRRLASRRR